MSFTQGDTVSWGDVQSLYTRLQTAYTKFSLGTISTPSNPGLTVPSTVSALKTAIENARSNSYVSRAGTYVTNVTVPSTGTYLYPDIFEQMSTTISNIQNTCAFNSAFFTSNHGFRTFSGNNGFSSNSFNTFHSRASSSNGSFSVANSFSS